MTTTEPTMDTTTNEAPAEQTPTWTSAEEMFPVPDGASKEEIDTIFAKRDEYTALIQRNNELEAANTTLNDTMTEQRERYVRNLNCFDVALTVAQQLVPLVGETDVVVKRPRGEVQVNLELETCTFTVRVEDGIVCLDMASKKPGVNPLTLTLDADGLSAANTLSVPFYVMLDTKAPLPKRAHEELIRENPLAKLMERAASMAGAPGLGAMGLDGLAGLFGGGEGVPCPGGFH